jgi:hypothetical protein
MMDEEIATVSQAAIACGIRRHREALPAPFNSIMVPDLSPDGLFDLVITNSGYQLGPQGIIALPTVTDANFFKLFTPSFTQGAISVTPDGSAVHIQGEIVTAMPVSNTVSSTVTLNVAGPNNLISIIDNAGNLSYGAEFSFDVANWTLLERSLVAFTQVNDIRCISASVSRVSVAVSRTASWRCSKSTPLSRTWRIDVSLAIASFSAWSIARVAISATLVMPVWLCRLGQA